MASENMARTGQTDETDRLISSDKVEAIRADTPGVPPGFLNHRWWADS